MAKYLQERKLKQVKKMPRAQVANLMSKDRPEYVGEKADEPGATKKKKSGFLACR